MTDVYVDLTAVAPGPSDSAPDPEAVRSLRLLAESGIRVILVSPDRLPSPDEIVALGAASGPAGWDLVSQVPARPEARCWYLTSEVARCRGASARLRTVLIGAAPAAGSVRRCDAVARDVQVAALEILAAEAMPAKL